MKCLQTCFSSVAVRLCLATTLLLSTSAAARAAELANSIMDWSTTGTQGENSWFYGWRNFSADGGLQHLNDTGELTYNGITDFIPFLNDGSGVVSQNGPNQWTGNQWDFGDGGPWTNLQAEASHPNGTNSAPNEEHWVIRRWVASSVSEPTQLELRSNLRAQNTNGPGTTIHLFRTSAVTGTTELLDTISTASGAGITNSVYPTVNPGDIFDLALTPASGGGDRTDGSDGSFFSLIVTDEEPPLPPIPPVADSLADWSGDGTQGTNNWFHGYYNLTQDTDGQYSVGEFQPFQADTWRGTQFRLVPSGAPWTTLGAQDTHPNGTNSAPNEEHWTVRRWVSDTTGPVALEWSMAKSNPSGTGVTGKLFVNGEEVDARTIAGNDSTGVTRTFYHHAQAGDVIDLALTPVGIGGDMADGADGSLNRLVVRDNLPDGPLFNPTGEILADSIADFSGNQGENSFVYGYYDQVLDVQEGNGVYEVQDMIPFLNDGSGVVSTATEIGGWKTHPNHWNGSKFDLLDNNAAGHGPWTEVTQNGGHPTANGQGDPEVHWAVRRWISETDEAVRIAGTLSNGSGDVIGRIFVDGEEIWSARSNGAAVNFSLDLDLELGQLVDFAIDPDGPGAFDPADPSTLANISDGSDGSSFFFTIERVTPFVIPEPGMMSLVAMALAGLALAGRRRR